MKANHTCAQTSEQDLSDIAFVCRFPLIVLSVALAVHICVRLGVWI